MEFMWEDYDDFVCFKFFNIPVSEKFNVEVEDHVLCIDGPIIGTKHMQLPFEALQHYKVSRESNAVILKLEKRDARKWNLIENIPPYSIAIYLEAANLKTNFTETDDSLSVHLYIKEINRDSTQIEFFGNNFVLLFSTSDSNFLKKFKKADSHSIFIWKAITRPLKPADCTFKLNKYVLEIFLKKLTNEKWETLLPASTHSKTSIPKDQWIPTITPSTLITPSYDKKLNNQEHLENEQKAPSVRRKGGSENIFDEKSKIDAQLALKSARQGLTGLNNLGNTCFMNSVIQCLSYTRELRQYFCDNSFKADLNRDNPLGMNGQLAVAFAVVLRQLWTGDSASISPSTLKSLVAEKSSQFQGLAQHDAQEFMALFLDGLHEDLNRVKSKPYIQYDDINPELPDHVIADTSWHKHKLRNDSIIVDLFHGQYKSTLICPSCGMISITFDPFLYLSVPLPPKPLTVKCTLFLMDPDSVPIRIQLSLQHNSNVATMLNEISCKFDIPVNYLSLWSVYKSTFHETFPYNTLLSSILHYNLCVYEIRPPIFRKEEILMFKVVQRTAVPNKPTHCSYCKAPDKGECLKLCTRCKAVVYCGRDCQSDDWKSHRPYCEEKPNYIGQPFIICLPRKSVNKEEIYLWMKKYSRQSVYCSRVPINPENCDASGNHNSSSRLGNNNLQRNFLVFNVETSGESKEDILKVSHEDLDLSKSGTLLMVWQNDDPSCRLEVTSKELKFTHYSSKQENLPKCSLSECLELFTEPEKLNKNDAWYCPRCKEHREATKQLLLWRLPKILIIQLKRFCVRSPIFRDKLDRLIDFPMNNLEMKNYLTKTAPFQISNYNLFGVVNHYGGMFGGHYTAYVKYESSVNGSDEWRICDDENVNTCEDEDVVTKQAYLLFYQKADETMDTID